MINYKIINKNKKAYFNYEIIKKFESGIVLFGAEVKAIKENKININNSIIKIKNDEIFVNNLKINKYSKTGNNFFIISNDNKKLLLNKKEIIKIKEILQEKKIQIIVLEVYLKKNRIKLLIGLAKIKNKINKKKDIIEKENKKKLFF